MFSERHEVVVGRFITFEPRETDVATGKPLSTKTPTKNLEWFSRSRLRVLLRFPIPFRSVNAIN